MTMGAPQFSASRCTRFRFRYSQCARCLEACPHDAIALDDEGARLDPVRCRGCGLCIAACHTEAWSSSKFQPIEQLRQAIRLDRWSIACTPSAAQADTLVPCLGAVHPVVLAYVAKRGLPLELRGAWHCAACAHGTQGAQRLAANLDATHALRAAASARFDREWIMPGVQRETPGGTPERRAAPRAHFDATRRQLLRRIAQPSSADAGAPHSGDPGAGVANQAVRAGPRVASERRDLLQIVFDRADGLPVVVPNHDFLPVMQLELRAGCTACEACFRACPTGALQIEENPDAWALTFQTERCVGCQVCLEACQPRVLDAREPVDARSGQAPQVLLSLSKQRCSRCERHFVSPSPQPRCNICCDDEDAFTAIFG